MRQKLGVIIGIAAVLAVLVLSFIILSFTGSNTAVSSEESDDSISVINVAKADVAEIHIVNSTGDYSLVQTEEKFHIKDREKYELIEYQVTALVTNLTGFSAYKSFPADGDLSAYGLDKPSGTAEIIKTDGSAIKLSVGTETPTGSIYAMTEDTSTVYVADRDKGEPILKSKFDYYNTLITSGSLDDSNFVSYSVTNKGKTVSVRKRTDEELSASGKILSDYVMTEPYSVDADAITIEGTTSEAGLLSRLAALTAYAVVGDTADAETLKKFSLYSPAYVLNVKYDTSESEILFSDMSEDGYYYAKRIDEELIYMVDAGVADILKYDALSFMCKDLYMLDITELKSLTVSYGGNEYRFSVANSESEINDEMKVSLSGEQLSQADFRTFYKNILSVDFNGLDAPKTGNACLILKFAKSGGGTDTIEFYKINDIDMCAEVNGRSYKVTKIAVDRIISDCTDYIDGKEIKAA